MLPLGQVCRDPFCTICYKPTRVYNDLNKIFNEEKERAKDLGTSPKKNTGRQASTRNCERHKMEFNFAMIKTD